MTRDEFNLRAQDMQRFCIATGLKWRTEERRGRDGRLTQGLFQVFYGEWRTVGCHHRPFQPDAVYEWFEDVATRFKFDVAGDVGEFAR